MEQGQLPIILFIMAFLLIAGFTINENDLEYLSVSHVLANFHEWMLWKLMPGW